MEMIRIYFAVGLLALRLHTAAYLERRAGTELYAGRHRVAATA